jgi:hypothetical protein
LWGKESKQLYLIEHLDEVFIEVQRRYQLAEGDFPKLSEYKTALSMLDFSTIPSIDRKVLNKLQNILIDDIPRITKHVAGLAIIENSTNNNANENSDNDDGRPLDSSISTSTRQQPVLFTINEKEKNYLFFNHHNNSQVFWIVSISIIVCLLALVIASIVDEHKLFYVVLEKLINDYNHVFNKES